MTRDAHPTSAAEQAPAELGRRFAARLLDAVLLGAVVGVAGVPLAFDTTWLVLAAVTIYGYFVVLDVAWGTTVGKRVVGLRVVGAAGGRATVAEAMAREAFVLLGAVPYVGPILAVAAWIAIAVSVTRGPLRQGLHDTMGGGTTVVRTG